jgi:hypothetical protein
LGHNAADFKPWDGEAKRYRRHRKRDSFVKVDDIARIHLLHAC